MFLRIPLSFLIRSIHIISDLLFYAYEKDFTRQFVYSGSMLFGRNIYVFECVCGV